jgi:hypothetical protein
MRGGWSTWRWGAAAALRGTSDLGPYPTNISLFANVIFWLAALIAASRLVRRVAPTLALRPDELLLIYVMLTIGTCLTSIDFLDVLFPMLGHPARYASPANGWQELFVRFIPRGFAVTDAEALKGWYTGNADPLEPRHLAAWLPSLLTWGVFILVLLFVMLCLVTLLRRPWTQYEKHSYPIIEMPLQMTDASGGFFRQPLLWVGFAVSGGICLLNGLSVLYPSIPSLPVKGQDVSVFFTERPWNAMGHTPVAFYPFAIGMGFLLPADMLFSSWFFSLMWRGQRIVSSYFGWSNYSPTFPYVNEQSFGAYMGVAALALGAFVRTLRASGRMPSRLYFCHAVLPRQQGRRLSQPARGARGGWAGHPLPGRLLLARRAAAVGRRALVRHLLRYRARLHPDAGRAGSARARSA